MSTRTLQIDVTDLAETMDFGVADGMTSYIDTRNGAIVHADDAPTSDDALIIPAFGKDYRYQRMLRFVATLDGEQQAVFAVALDGAGAFRRFKNLVNQRGLADAWYGFQLGLDRAEAMDWLARQDVDVIDVSKRLPATAPAAATPGPAIGLVDLLLLGGGDGAPAVSDGRVRRQLRTRSPEQSRELFWGLVREICAETGVTVPATTGATGEPEAIDAGRFHLRRRDDVVELDVDVEAGIVDRFAR
jgi:hypothetical protein